MRSRTACLALAPALLLVMTAFARSETPSTSAFARGLVELVRVEKPYDPRLAQKLLGVTLRNPQKWTEQPDGTFRTATWRWPANRWGVSEVQLNDVPVDREIHSHITIEMRGRPCLSVRQLEAATRSKATYGGQAMTLVFDGPSGFVELGDEHAQLGVRGVSGQENTLFVETDRPGPRGCVVLAQFEVVRRASPEPPSAGARRKGASPPDREPTH